MVMMHPGVGVEGGNPAQPGAGGMANGDMMIMMMSMMSHMAQMMEICNRMMQSMMMMMPPTPNPAITKLHQKNGS